MLDPSYRMPLRSSHPDNRVGVFEYACTAGDELEISGILAAMQFVPQAVDYCYYRHCYIAKGWSPMFREISDGEAVPTYDVVIRNDDGNRRVEVKERGNR